MAFPDFGGSDFFVETVADENATGRYNRDVAQQGKEQVLTVAEGASLSSYTESTIAATAAGGRTYRTLLQESTERKDRLYVDYATGNSAVTGTADADYTELKAGVNDANIGAAQTDIVNYDGMSASSPLEA